MNPSSFSYYALIDCLLFIFLCKIGNQRKLYVTVSCTPIFGPFNDDISSIDVGNACIKVYKEIDCYGREYIYDGLTKNTRFQTQDNLNTFDLNDKIQAMALS